MAKNKILFGNQTLLDLTSDTIVANKLASGKTAHDASGNQITGTYNFATATTANAIASDVTEGKTGWANGIQIIGTKKGIPTFDDGTDAEIAEALDKHYAGEIDLTEYWSVGDKRTIHLSHMDATGVSESHFDANGADYKFVIIGMNHDDLQTPINGKTKAVITIQQDRILYANTTDQTYYSSYPSADDEGGYMNSSNTNYGGWTSCARRTWCNDVYYNALPSTIKNKVKTVQKLTSAGSASSTINTDNDKVFLLSEIEIFGTRSNSFAGEGSQYSYFAAATSNRNKKPAYSSNVSAIWWERSPHGSFSDAFCRVDDGGGANSGPASRTYGLAPAFCL